MRAGGNFPDAKTQSYIPLKNNSDKERRIRSPREDDNSDAEESRINFTGVRSAAAVKNRQLEELDNSPNRNQSNGE